MASAALKIPPSNLISPTVYLKEPVPVYLVYFTAFVTDDGDVALRRDIYGRDKMLVDALRGSES